MAMTKGQMHNARVFAAHIERDQRKLRRILRNEREAAMAIAATPKESMRREFVPPPPSVDWFRVLVWALAVLFCGSFWYAVFRAILNS
jgi:hypothetical protein